MTLIREMKLTPHQARELIHLGFIVKLVSLFGGDVDLYRIYVR